MPRVSVILPTYNDIAYLETAIESALDQSYQNFELIVVNDGSTDSTKEYLDSLANPKLRIIHKPNGGCFDALNYGIEASEGELITWVSSDNISPNHFLDALVAGIDSSETAKFAYASYYNIDDSNDITSINLSNYQFPHELVSGNHRGSTAFIYYKTCHEKVGPYIDSHACDTDMWAKLSSCFPAVYIIEPTYFYRLHDQALTASLNGEYWHNEREKSWKEFIDLHGEENIIQSIYPVPPKNVNTEVYHTAANDLAIRFMQKSHINIAMRLWKESILNTPASVLKLITHNLAQISGSQPKNKEKILKLFKAAIHQNKTISKQTASRYTKRLIDLTQDAMEDGASDFLTNEKWIKNVKLSQIQVFSYFAWKQNMRSQSTSILPSHNP